MEGNSSCWLWDKVLHKISHRVDAVDCEHSLLTRFIKHHSFKREESDCRRKKWEGKTRPCFIHRSIITPLPVSPFTQGSSLPSRWGFILKTKDNGFKVNDIAWGNTTRCLWVFHSRVNVCQMVTWARWTLRCSGLFKGIGAASEKAMQKTSVPSSASNRLHRRGWHSLAHLIPGLLHGNLSDHCGERSRRHGCELP